MFQLEAGAAASGRVLIRAKPPLAGAISVTRKPGIFMRDYSAIQNIFQPATDVPQFFAAEGMGHGVSVAGRAVTQAAQ